MPDSVETLDSFDEFEAVEVVAEPTHPDALFDIPADDAELEDQKTQEDTEYYVKHTPPPLADQEDTNPSAAALLLTRRKAYDELGHDVAIASASPELEERVAQAKTSVAPRYQDARTTVKSVERIVEVPAVPPVVHTAVARAGRGDARAHPDHEITAVPTDEPVTAPGSHPRPVGPRERSEDGQVPAGELDRVLADMSVLLRYGQLARVRDRLEQLHRRFPEDLLLLRRIADFHLETGDREGGVETLFLLAARLFERRNVEGAKRALEQLLALDPNNERAGRLLDLLEARPITNSGR